ncbi:hypothetical protein EDD18DRAFT_1347857 [Armillaria luteobubalina]|uniref:FAD/NAD(P)-binding domain-containing protein n=1 Tax=Armillaria luteobubalina TaxID=153913 RepID=A0AA39QHN7_9AGAR|nr:hypothetical protein EDD18DRAFT_1347857 [Armillaria luteobubalina]
MTFLWTLVAALGLYYVLLSLQHVLRRRLLLAQTCVSDVDSLGHRSPAQKIKGTAVICGGSIAGLTAARVCHDHFEDVVIIEPEAWLNSADAMRSDSRNQENKRSRVMQYESFHILLTIGYTAMKKLFPNFIEECRSSAIRTGPNDTQVHLWGNGVKKPYDEYGGTLPKTIYTGRVALETLLRRLVLGGEYKNIRQITGTATGVSRNASNPRFIEQVSIRAAEGAIVAIPAALVIDCTGSTTAGLKWLQREGCGYAHTYSKIQRPLDGLKIAYDQKLRYSTLQFSVPPELGRRLAGLPVPYDECGVIYCLIADPERENRGVYSQRIDGDFVQICFSVTGGDGVELPANLEEAKTWTRSLITEVPIPEEWFAMLDMLEEVQESMTCSQVPFGPSTWIQYEKGVNLPSNWLAAGDSVMKVNPLHGHGCSKAMYGAICLNQLLQTIQSSIPEDFSQKYFRMQAAKIEPLWSSTKVADYAFGSTEPVPGETRSEGALLRWYMKRLMILSFTDARAGSAIWHFRVLLAPSIDLLQPRLVFKVLWSLIKP